jgi:hypothetical protein
VFCKNVRFEQAITAGLTEEKVDLITDEYGNSKLTEKEKELIWGHVPKYVLSTPDKQYRKNPETYLNNKCWNDEIIYKNGNNGAGQQSTGKTDYERAMDQQAVRKARREANL